MIEKHNLTELSWEKIFCRCRDLEPTTLYLMSFCQGITFRTENSISLIDHYAPVGSQFSGVLWTVNETTQGHRQNNPEPEQTIEKLRNWFTDSRAQPRPST